MAVNVLRTFNIAVKCTPLRMMLLKATVTGFGLKVELLPYMFLHLTLLLIVELILPQISLKHAGQHTLKVNQSFAEN